eukprot:925245-Pelagomonas_calceolata.AAC.12
MADSCNGLHYPRLVDRFFIQLPPSYQPPKQQEIYPCLFCTGKVKGSKGNGKGAEFLQIDRVRVLSARLIADLLVSWPAAALEVQPHHIATGVRHQ